MRRGLSILGFTLAIAGSAHAEELVVATNMKARDFLATCSTDDAEKREGCAKIIALTAVSAVQTGKEQNSCLIDADALQHQRGFLDTVMKFLETHPDMQDRLWYEGIIFALKDAYPCRE